MKTKILIEKFEQHKTLNPKIWDTTTNQILPEIKDKLLQIIDVYCEESQCITKKDIIMAEIVGSNASFNYNSKSDADLHLVVDMERLSKDKKFAQLANQFESQMFNKRYDIGLKGCEVEIYIEDIKTTAVSNGIYSLFDEKWIKEPKKYDISINQNKYQAKYNDTEQELKKLLKDCDDIDTLQSFLNKLYKNRTTALQSEGEPADDNQIFKDLRANGLLDNLKDKIIKLQEKDLSLNESGYDGWQMSNNARQAYEDGEKPKSKWTKQQIINALKTHDKYFDLIEKLSITTLRDMFLIKSSWHHTSSYYNKTNFYKINVDRLNDLTEQQVKEIIANTSTNKTTDIQQPAKVIKKCHYLTWEGTTKHPKPVHHEEECEIQGNWAITSNGKKSIKANGFYFIESVNKVKNNFKFKLILSNLNEATLNKK